MHFFKKIFNSRSQQNGNFFMQVSEIIGFKPANISLYEKAFTHRSMNIKDEDGNAINYERLEFLGDSMVSSIISSYLFKEVPSGNEGYLTKMRSKVVSREHLNELGSDLRLIDLIKTRIKKENFGNNIHGNLFEALVGAIFLDKGYRACEEFIHDRVIEPYVDIKKLESKIISHKSLLIEWCQKNKKDFFYQVYEDTGNEVLKHFAVKLFIQDKMVAKARATSKKKAEEKASKRAYFALKREIYYT